jgi:hypothetical protein
MHPSFKNWLRARLLVGLGLVLGVLSVACSPASRTVAPGFFVPAYPGLPPLKSAQSARAPAQISQKKPIQPPRRSVRRSSQRAFARLEMPYKLGHSRRYRSQAEYAQSIRERRHWNRGGVGQLLSPIPAMKGHPKPRVIVNVDSLQGPHKKSEVLRLARRYHWKAVVDCYRLGAYKNSQLRGWTNAQVSVAPSGVVRAAQLRSTELPDERVAQCITDKLRNLRFSRKNKGSRAILSIRVAPGDEPTPPPEEAIVPGPGLLDQDAVRLTLIEGMPDVMACYRASFVYAPELWGRLIVRFYVDDYGRVKGAYEVGTRFPAQRVVQCLLRKMRRLRFPNTDGGEIRFLVPLRLWSERSNHRPSGG